MYRLVAAGLAVCSAGFVMSCGGAKPEVEGAQKPAAEAAPTSTWEPPEIEPADPKSPIGILGITPPEDKPWNDMNYTEKEWYMIGKVHPVMRQIFQTYNAKKYEGDKFECVPCHGENPEARKYKMPSEHLSPVPEFGSADWKAAENSRMVKFMSKRVTPAMGKLIGEQPWNPETGEGYSCWGCHPKAK